MSQECNDEFQAMFHEIFTRPENRKIRAWQAEALASGKLGEREWLAMGSLNGVSRAAQEECRFRLAGRWSKKELDLAAEAAVIPTSNEL